MHVKSVPYLYVKAKVIVVDNLGREHNDTISGEVSLQVTNISTGCLCKYKIGENIMKKKLLIIITIFIFSLVLSSCAYKEFEDNLKSDMNNKEQNINDSNIEPGIDQDNNISNINDNDETIAHNEVPPIEDSSIYETGEKVTYTFGENTQEYTITKATEGDHIYDLDQNHFIDKTLIEDGKLKEGYKFIMLDVMVKNISQFSNESGELYVSELSLVKRDDSEEDRLYPPEVTYFKNPAKDSDTSYQIN